MKHIFTLTLLFLFLLGNAQDLLTEEYDSIKECPASNIRLVYKENKTAVYWQSTLLFAPSKNFYYYFESGETLGEVDYETKEIYFTVFDKKTGEYDKILKNEEFIKQRNKPYSGYCGNSKLSEIQKAWSMFSQISAWKLDIEIFDKIISIRDLEIKDEDSFDPKRNYKSCIYDLLNSTWVIASGVHQIQEIDNYFLVGTKKDSIIYHLYFIDESSQIKKLHSFSKDSPDIYIEIFNLDSLTPIQDSYSPRYRTYKGNKSGEIGSTLFSYVHAQGRLYEPVPAEYDFFIHLNNKSSSIVHDKDSLYIICNYYSEQLTLILDSKLYSSYSNLKRYTHNSNLNFYNDSAQYPNGSFRMDIIKDSLFLIIENSLEREICVIDSFGEPQYDEDGFPLTKMTPGEYTSGLFNSNHKKWVIPNIYYEAYFIKDFIITVNPEFQFEENIRTGLYQYDIYDLNGKLIRKNVREGDNTVLDLFYPESKITSLGNNEYYIEQNGIYSWIEFSFTNGTLFKAMELKRSNTEWIHKVKHQSTEPFDPKKVKQQ